MGIPNRNMWNIHYSKRPFAYFGNRRPGYPAEEICISVSNEAGKVLVATLPSPFQSCWYY